MKNLSENRILIVGDTKTNLKIMVDTLKDYYRIGVATNGQSALDYAKQNQPDLILLDIMMPGMDGFEVCRRLKADNVTKDIAIIFITAMDDVEDKTKGLELGAVDYITKPFNTQEVLVRTKTHLTLINQRKELKQYTNRLEEMVQERTRQLTHSERLATLGTFAAAVIHEIQNPNTAIMGYAELLNDFSKESESVLEQHAQEEINGRPSYTVADVNKMINSIIEGSQKITEMAGNLKAYSRKEAGGKKRVHKLRDVLGDALSILAPRLKKNNIRVETMIPDTCQVNCNAQQISQAIVNLVNNAADAMTEGG